jgi:hypothetical protein
MEEAMIPFLVVFGSLALILIIGAWITVRRIDDLPPLGRHHEKPLSSEDTATLAAVQSWRGLDEPGAGQDCQMRAEVTAPGRLGAYFAGPPSPPAPEASRPGHRAQGDPATGPAQKPRLITGPGRAILAKHPTWGHWGPVTLWTVPLLEEACATAALLALAESVLAGAAT